MTLVICNSPQNSQNGYILKSKKTKQVKSDSSLIQCLSSVCLVYHLNKLLVKEKADPSFYLGIENRVFKNLID